MSRVEAIMERVNDRTYSLAGSDDPSVEVTGVIVDEEQGELMFVGLPLTSAECEEYIETLHLNMVKLALMGVPPMAGVEALWRHAVMFGLLAHTVEERS